MDSYFEVTESNENVDLNIRSRPLISRLQYDDRDAYFGKIKHNLLEDLEAETPPKRQKMHCYDTTSKVKRANPSASLSSTALNTNQHTKSISSSNMSRSEPKCEGFLSSMKEKEVEMIGLRATNVNLKSEINTLEKQRRESLIEHDREMAKLRSEREVESVKKTEMRSKLQFVMERERLAKEECLRLERELNRQKNEMDKKILAVQKQNLELTDAANQQEAIWLEIKASLEEENMKSQREISNLESKLEEVSAQLALKMSLQIEATQREEDNANLALLLQKEKDKNEELQRQVRDNEENMLLSSALKADIEAIPMMKEELEQLRNLNEQLKHNEQNTMILEEQVRTLKRKLKSAEERSERMVHLELTNEELEGRLQRWEAMDTSGSRRPQSPSSLTRKVNDVEFEKAELLMKFGEVQTELKSTTIKMDKVCNELKSLKIELSGEKINSQQASDLVKRLKRKLLLVTKERDSYKNVLDSYESEATINMDMKSRIHDLEEVIQSYRKQLETTEVELSNVCDELTDLQRKYEQAEQQLLISKSENTDSSEKDLDSIRQLRERTAELENNLMKAEEERDVLEARIEQRHLQGDYDPTKVKVIQFKMNPFAIARQKLSEEMDKLREENDKLRKRNEILEEEGANLSNLTMQVADRLQEPSPLREVEDMKAKLKKEEMRNQRLTEVFKKTSQEFREICYQLTGYKIDFSSTTYKVTSMYAESPHDFLLFKQDDKGDIQMLQTDFSSGASTTELIQLYLQQHNSIPMFLSALTQELFSKQTLFIT